MSNIEKVKKALKKVHDAGRAKSVTITIRGCDSTMERLEAVGAEDLREYFVPKGLHLKEGDNVTVFFTY